MAFTLPDIDGLIDYTVGEIHGRVTRRTPVRTGRAQAAWQRADRTITNDTPYIGYLENGTSEIRPYAMVRTTLAETSSIIADYLSRNKGAKP